MDFVLLFAIAVMKNEHNCAHIFDIRLRYNFSPVAHYIKHKRLMVSTYLHMSVCRSVRKVYCGKTADWIRMPFGMGSGVGRGMGVLDGGNNRRRGRGRFGGEFGASHCNYRRLRRGCSQITLGRTCYNSVAIDMQVRSAVNY